MAGFSNYLENELLDFIFTDATGDVSAGFASVFVSLHSADPGETGASEISASGGGQLRNELARNTDWNSASSGLTDNANAITFSGMPSATITHIGIWDNSAGAAENFLFGGSLSATAILNSGDTFEIAAGDLDITLD